MVATKEECPDSTAAIGSLATLLILATIALVGCIAALITVIMYYQKLRNMSKKGGHSPRKQAIPTPVRFSKKLPPTARQNTGGAGSNKSPACIPNVGYDANLAECDKETRRSQRTDITEEYEYLDT